MFLGDRYTGRLRIYNKKIRKSFKCRICSDLHYPGMLVIVDQVSNVANGPLVYHIGILWTINGSCIKYFN